MIDIDDDAWLDTCTTEEWHAYWEGRCGHCGALPPVYGFQGGECPLHPVYVPLGPYGGEKPVVRHSACREVIDRWLGLHHCAARGKAFVSNYYAAEVDGWEWGTYCCCGECEVVGAEVVEVEPEQLTLDLAVEVAS